MCLAVHSCSVVHGDLSGVGIIMSIHNHVTSLTGTLQSNVLIRESGRAYIADFGLSMLLTELGGSTFATSLHARGTLRWTAPELLDLEVPEDGMEEESPHIAPTTQSDVYSFGGVMLQVRGTHCPTHPTVRSHVHVGQILSGNVPYHYYTREAQVVHAVSRGISPRRPNSALVTERRWMFIGRCWSTIDVVRSRPSGEEIVEFTEEELAGTATS